MIDISMLRISPKLIDVERCRIPFIDQKDISKVKSGQINDNRTDPNIKHGDILVLRWQPEPTSDYGRFPTQLFTNIKNDRYKYVKNITEIDKC